MTSNKLNYNACLNDSANAIVADDRELLRKCIGSVATDNCKLAEAWLMQAWSCESLQEAQVAVQRALGLDPNNEIAVAGLNWIHGIQELAEYQLEAKRQAEEDQRKAEEEARIKAKAEAQRKAEKEARVKAEADAMRKAEEEARQKAKAEADAMRKADEEARQKAKAEAKEEAKRKAEKAAQEKAEAKAKRQAEKEARLKAKAEAQSEAKKEAKLKAEEKSRRESKDESGSENEVESEVKESVESLASEIRQEVEPAEEKAADTASTDTFANRKPVVLAVDDSPTVRKLVSLTLCGEGFEVITAADGIDALNILSEQLPDIILSDINMPKLNGYKLCKFVKKHERTNSIPVVMLSGKDGVFDKMRGKMSGCDDFISKPFESTELVDKVREILTAANSH